MTAPQATTFTYFLFSSIAFSRSLIPSWEALTDWVRDSLACSGLWNPSLFSAVHHSQRMWARSWRGQTS